MDIEVRLFATFRKGRWKKKTLTYDQKIKIKRILNDLDIKEKEIGIILLNGTYKKPDAILNDGDILSIFPPVAGG